MAADEASLDDVVDDFRRFLSLESRSESFSLLLLLFIID